MMDKATPLTRNQLLIVDFVEKNPGCLFEQLLEYMINQKVSWQEWYPDDYMVVQQRLFVLRDFWPQPDKRDPDRKRGYVKLFPQIVLLETDYANELLSDDARAVLAYIRDHPGLRQSEIGSKMKLDKSSFDLAFRILRARNLIQHHFVASKNNHNPNAVSGYLTFYPA
jgi:hypothetical protein